MAEEIDYITGQIIDAAIKIHRQFGPGLSERVYEVLLEEELRRRGFRVQRQKRVALELDGRVFNRAFRVDLLVNDRVVVEVKCRRWLSPAHWRQVLTYLRAMRLEVGLLINFGGATLKEGVHRVVNHYRPPASSPLRVNARERGEEGRARVRGRGESEAAEGAPCRTEGRGGSAGPGTRGAQGRRHED